MAAPTLKLQPSARDKVFHRIRCERFSGRGMGGNTRPDVDRNAGDLGPVCLTFPGVNAAAHFEAELFRLFMDSPSTAYRSSRAIKYCEEPIPSSIDNATSKVPNLPLCTALKLAEQIAPTYIAHGGSLSSRLNDIGKHHSCQNCILDDDRPFACQKLLYFRPQTIHVPDEIQMILARQFDEPGSGNVPGEVPAVTGVYQLIPRSVQYEGRHADRWQQRSDINFYVHAIQGNGSAWARRHP